MLKKKIKLPIWSEFTESLRDVPQFILKAPTFQSSIIAIKWNYRNIISLVCVSWDKCKKLFPLHFCFLSYKAISMGYNLEINWPFIACVSTKSTPNESQFEFYERPSTLASDFNATRLGPMAAKLKIIDTLHWS